MVAADARRSLCRLTVPGRCRIAARWSRNMTRTLTRQAKLVDLVMMEGKQTAFEFNMLRRELVTYLRDGKDYRTRR